MAGTHWYHPHVHGGSSIQVGGGALGMLIVDDPPGSLPQAVAGANERHLVISDLRPFSLAHVARRSESACRQAGGSEQACREPFWANAVDDGEVLMLVNGRREPQMQLEAMQWYRFRLLFGSAGGEAGADPFTTPPPSPSPPPPPDADDDSYSYDDDSDSDSYDESEESDDDSYDDSDNRRRGRRLVHGDWEMDDLRPSLAGCEVQLLAKDGVYLHQLPRPITVGYMFAGSRADWLVRCPAGSHALVDESRGVTLVHIDVTPSARPPAAPIAPFAVRRPCYLADLTAASHVSSTHSFELKSMSMQIATDNRAAEPFPGGDRPAATLRVGTVAEMLVKGTSHMSHIFHMHVNPFQLQDVVPAQNRAGNYFQRGDWHDTIRDVMSSHGHHHGHGHLRTRFQTDTFTGTVPIHCHYLVHEDQARAAPS